MSSAPHPARSSLARVGRNSKQALANSPLFSRVRRAIELVPKRMQMQHVGGGIGDLRLRQRAGTPVRELLLLGQFDPQKVAGDVFQAVLVGIGARQPRGDLGAEERVPASRRRRDRAPQYRTARSERSSAWPDRPEAFSGSERRSRRARSAPRRPIRRRATAAPRRGDRDAGRDPWSRCRWPPRRCSARGREGRRDAGGLSCQSPTRGHA